MAETRRRGSVRVRGTCRAGHTTETTSDPGRVTWEGVCAHDGCEHKVKARRVPASTPEAKDKAAETAEKTKPKPRLKKVDYAVVEHPEDQPAPDERAGDRRDPAADPRPAPAAAVQGGAGGPDREHPDPAAEHPADGPVRRRGLRDRLAARRENRSEWRFATPLDD